VAKLYPWSPDVPPTVDLERLEETYDGFFTPRFTLTVGDLEITEADAVVSEVSVETTVDGAGSFEFTLAPPFDHEAGEFESIEPETGLGSAFDWEAFAAGTPVAVAMGYGDTQPTLLRGTIRSVRPDYPEGGAPTVTVHGYDGLHSLAVSRASAASWDDVSIGDVVEGVVAEAGFAETELEDAEGTTMTYAKIERPPEVGDLAFVRELARRVGFEAFVVPAERGEKFYFRSPGFEGEPVVRVRYGESLRSFSPEVNTAGQVGTVTVHGYDPVGREAITGTAENPGGGPIAGEATGAAVLQVPVRSQQEAEVRAAAELDRRRGDLVRGRGETFGIPAIRAGETIVVDGLGETYSGTYYVEEATHRVGSEGYTTEFGVARRET